MPTKVDRKTVDLSGYPDLIVIYLGMRVNRLTGIRTLMGFGPQIFKSVAEQPDGLLRHENLIISLFPVHLAFRQYWRDMDSLLKVDALGAAPTVVGAVSQGRRGHRFLA